MLAATSNKLNLKNPNQIHGLFRIAIGLGLLAVIGSRLPTLIAELESLRSEASGDPRWLLEDPKRIAEAITLGLASLAVALGILHTLVAIVGGLRNIIMFFIPVGVPKSISDADKTLENFFRHRVITTFKKPTGLIWTAAALLSERIRYVTRPVQDIPQKFISSSIFWVCAISSLLALQSFTAGIEDLPDILRYEIPSSLCLIASFIVLVRLAGVVSSLPSRPQVTVSEKRHHLDSTGHPTNFFNHLMHSANVLRVKNFPNRELYTAEPALGRTRTGDTNEYNGVFVFETQPTPANAQGTAGAIVFDIGGSALRVSGYALMMHATTLFPSAFGQGRPIDSALCLLAGIVAARKGTEFLRIASRLHNVFRWQSDVFWIEVRGTYTASRIGVGDGRGGQLFSERAVFQSDTNIHYYAARILSESLGLESDRSIIGSQDTADFRQRRDYLDKEILNFRDTGGRLADIDLGEEAPPTSFRQT